MFFGAVPTGEAAGAVLAHSIQFGRTKFRKGRCLSAEDIAAIAEAGIAELTVARLDEGDMDEDAAAAAVAAALVAGGAAGGFSVSAPFTGRVNLFAEAPGVVRIDAAAVAALNAVDPAITLATLPDFARVQARQMVATVKIIPYGDRGREGGAGGECARGVEPAAAPVRGDAREPDPDARRRGSRRRCWPRAPRRCWPGSRRWGWSLPRRR